MLIFILPKSLLFFTDNFNLFLPYEGTIGQEKRIKELLDKRVSYSAIGRILGVHRLTVSSFVKEKLQIS